MVTATYFVVVGFFGMVVGLYMVCFMHVPQIVGLKRHEYVLGFERAHCSRTELCFRPERLSLEAGHCMYILLFACACGKRAVVTAPHYILHMFCLFCTCVGCAHYMLQDCGSLLCTSTLKRIVSVDANGKHVTVIEEYKQQLVHLYLHQNDARTLHLSLVVSIARW